MNANRLFWGLIIVAFGLMILLVNFGIIPREILTEVWRLWPLLLIFWGISLLVVKDNRSSLLFSVMMAILLLAVIFGFSWLFQSGRIANQASQHSIISEDLGQATTEGDLKIKFGASKLNIESGTEKFIEGESETVGGIEVRRSGTEILKKMELNQVSTPTFFWGQSARNELNLKLNQAIEYSLSLETGASDFSLRLGDLKVSSLEVSSGATSGEITIGSKYDRPELAISTGASSYQINVPKSMALVIYSSSGLTSNNFSEAGLKKSSDVSGGDTVYSDDLYLANKDQGQLVTIRFSSGASSINISRY